MEQFVCVAIAVVEDRGRFLVGVRPEGVPLAGMAELPGGKVDPGETPAAAAVRECWEEAGLKIEAIDEYLATTHRYEHGLMELHFFRCRVAEDGGRLPQWPFRWVEARELAELQFPAANLPVTERLIRTANSAVNAS